MCKRSWRSLDTLCRINRPLMFYMQLKFMLRSKKKKPLLTEKHKKARLAWATKHQYWAVHDWRSVIFSVETKINIWGPDGCKYYWKKKTRSFTPSPYRRYCEA